ncbi:MAG: DUF5060 domain-containing protein [Roseiflexaceae bacterium]|nr:DUF5060 domain-containing protein [Roseiflexaceae bacterium]
MPTQVIPKWSRFEVALISQQAYENPFQDADLKATFVSPSNQRVEVDGFWDGGNIWRIRFAPTELGSWEYSNAARIKATAHSTTSLAGSPVSHLIRAHHLKHMNPYSRCSISISFSHP